MTTELEKNFFDTFGIEPKYQDTCTVEEKYWDNEELANEYGTFDQYMNAKCGNQENCSLECSCAYQKEIYPQITDKEYIELYCILCDVFNLFDVCRYPVITFRVKDFKENVLKELIQANKYYKQEYIKNQIQKIFF